VNIYLTQTWNKYIHILLMPFSTPIFLQVMVATVRCEEIANEKYGSFVANEV